ncbi:hypothetical protein [Rhabdothermincola salaria]|uniref:hypothetical protein n=1 Tax=Rhabdothermincola salaria TaxID=2903142 RepID=UPI001E4CE5D9|nr:hypothetical protein [Rhabdothermincola salaria]MCD9625254.1 hypothetical protein [Rhabdothermincola salaria]
MTSADPAAPGPQFDILISELAEARDDERSMVTQYVALVSIGLALVLALAVLLFRTCPAGYCEDPLASAVPGSSSVAVAGDAAVQASNPSTGSVTARGLTIVPSWVYFAAPLLPVALLSFGALLSAEQTLRSYYVRRLETQLHDLSGQAEDELPLPSWEHLQLEVHGQRDGSRLALANWSLLYVVLVGLLFGIVLMATIKLPTWRLRGAGLLVNVAITLVPVLLANRARNGYRLWHDAEAKLGERLERTRADFPDPRSAPPARADSSSSITGVPAEPGDPAPADKSMAADRPKEVKQRSFIGWLLVPRAGEELFVKPLIGPILAVLTTLLVAGQFDDEWFLRLATVFLVFEFGVYQARYLLNDVRDRYQDRALGKRRMPLTGDDQIDRVRVEQAFLAFVARLTGALALAVLLPPSGGLGLPFLVLISVGVFAIAAPYERLRSAIDTQQPSPTLVWLLTAMVGLGYGLRTLAGLWVVGGLSPLSLAVGAITGAALGSLFVALTWALESTGRSSAAWQESTNHRHFAIFRTWIETRCTTAINTKTAVLKSRQGLMVPWSIWLLVATPFASGFVLITADETPSPAIVGAVLLIAFGVGWGGALPRVEVSGLVAISGLALTTACLWSLGPRTAVLSGLILIGPLVVSVAFRSQSFDQLRTPPIKLSWFVVGWKVMQAWFATTRDGGQKSGDEEPSRSEGEPDAGAPVPPHH